MSNIEIQQLKVYYKNQLLIFKKDYDIINNKLTFRKPVQNRNIIIKWENINER